MIEIAYTQHMGNIKKKQQDALWNGQKCIQKKNLRVHSSVLSTPCFLAIADGVSSSPFPHLASRFILECLAIQIQKKPPTSKDIKNAHMQLCQKYANGVFFGSATTFVGVHFDDHDCTIVNVGDSRAYIINAENQLKQETKDHTVINDFIETGICNPTIEHASIYNGLSSCIIADHSEDNFSIHTKIISIKNIDNIIICSDGFISAIGNTGIINLYSQELSTFNQVSLWKAEAIKNRPRDNFSIIFARKKPAF